ncbi:hypothetical protein [Flavobacterium sp.]|uniref:hypothetical protein n=1 Tax=Flavobacterium sp. TaxID=239 RepID=UPI0039E58552
MEDKNKFSNEELNEILKQKTNQDNIFEKAMFLRQPPSTLTNQNASNINNPTNQSSETENKKGDK